MYQFDHQKNMLLERIRKSVNLTEPEAEIILFGSQARGDHTRRSDYDLLILVKKEQLSYAEEQKIRYPLYDIEIETGKLISLIVMPWNTWHTKHKGTQFYENISRQGIRI